MIFRNCAGGVVFFDDKVFLLQNDKSEWVLPKGVIRAGMLAQEVAVARVKAECGIDADIVCTAGATSYEFYSLTRKKPVCNEITWYIMRAKNGAHAANKDEGFQDGAYFSMEEAAKRITYSQDKSLLRVSFDKYRQHQAKK